MDKIPYLMSLTPAKRLIASLYFVIVFLAAGWFRTDYKYNEYRSNEDKLKARMEREKFEMMLDFYNKLKKERVDQYQQLDSSRKMTDRAIENIEKTLQNLKR